MKPFALMEASDNLDAFEEAAALGGFPLRFLGFSPITNSQSGSADATELGAFGGGAADAWAEESDAFGGWGSAVSELRTEEETEQESAHLSEVSELLASVRL